MGHVLSRILGWVVTTSAFGAATIVVIPMALVVADIFGRKVLNKPVPMSYEFASFMLRIELDRPSPPDYSPGGDLRPRIELLPR